MTWLPGHGFIASRSVCGSYLVQRMASPHDTWMAHIVVAVGHLAPVGPARGSVAEAQADAELHACGDAA